MMHNYPDLYLERNKLPLPGTRAKYIADIQEDHTGKTGIIAGVYTDVSSNTLMLGLKLDEEDREIGVFPESLEML